MEKTIVLQRMIYQPHNLRILNCHLQMSYETPTINFVLFAVTVG